MWKNKLRKEKLQFILITIILIITTTMFSTAFIFYFSVSSEIENYYEEKNVADGYLFDSSKKEAASIKEACQKGEIIKNYNQYKASYFPTTIKTNNKEFNEDRTLIISFNDVNSLEWSISIVSGNKKEKAPNKDEIWVSKIFADKRGLKVGDELNFDIAKNKSFKISAIIKDSQNGSLSNPAKIVYVNKQDISCFDSKSKGVFITFDDVKSEQKSLSFINANCTENQYFMSKFDLISNQKGDTEILSLIMAFAGLIVLISGILVIKFTLKSNLMREYKSIGTYKALGFKDREIKKIYKNAYLFVGIIGALVGSILGMPIAYNIEKKSLKYLLDVGFNINYLIIAIVTIILFNIIVQIIVNNQLRKIKKITPIEAISINYKNNVKSQKGRLFKNASNPFTLAVNDILKNKSMSLTMVLLITMYMFIILFFVNFSYSENNASKNYNVWLNLHKTSATITGVISSKENEEEIVNYLNESNLVRNYGYGLYLNAGNYIKYDSDKYGLLYMYAIETFSTYDKLGFDVESGRLPKEYNEINVSLRLLNDLNLKVGDNMTFKVNGKDESFKIVGSFGSIKYGGWNVRFLNSAMNYYELQPRYNTIAIQLNNDNDFKKFKNEFESKFDNFYVSKDLGIYEDLMTDLTKSIPPVVNIIAYLMIILSVLNIICIISMIIIDKRKHIGIQKALGFKDKFIKSRIALRVMLLSLIGVILALVIHNSISRSMIASIMVCPKAIVFSLSLTILYCLLILIIILVTVYVSNLAIDKISAIELMEE